MNSLLLEKKFLILQETSHLITATNDINALANFLLDRAIEYTNAEKGSLMLLTEKDELYILASRGFDMKFIETYRIKLGEGIAGIVAQDRNCRGRTAETATAQSRNCQSRTAKAGTFHAGAGKIRISQD